MSIDRQTVQRSSSGKIGIALQRFGMNMHIGLYRLTGGFIGGKLAGRPMLLLTTMGRKSGKERTTPLQYTPYEENFLLVASNGGATRHPQWWLNLQAQPQAMIQVGPQRLKVTARQADAEEHKRLWSFITTRYPNFADYQRRTTRSIPVVILTPDHSA